MARTALTGLLRRIHAAHAEAAFTKEPAADVFERQRRQRLSRAEFLAGAAGASATVLAACASQPAKTVMKTASAPRIVIVGGGLAGTVCAYRLWQAGVPFTLCEANSAFGGRTWTLRNFFDEGQIIEHGGEFISSEHASIRKLARELGLRLADLRAAQPHGTEEIYYVRGGKYMVDEMLRDYARVYPAIAAAAKAAPFPTTYDHHTAVGAALDRMSVRQWIEKNVPGGVGSRIGWLLDIDATTENGGDSTQQTALELIYMLGYMPALTGHGQFYMVGTDERYNVVGGNDQIVRGMVSRLPAAALRPNAALTALRRRSDGSYVLTFSSSLQTVDLTADHVVLAVPFTTLRRCDLAHADFEPRKMQSINHLPLGTNTKLHAQFKDRLWYKQGYNGYTYSDKSFQQTWEVTRAQAGSAGVLTSYYGGAWGASFKAPSFGPANPAYTREFLNGLEPIYAGSVKAWNGKAFMDYWTGDPWHRGSYSYIAVGQSTQFYGIEGVPQGNVRFAGEHVSVDFGGFMNGAVETGERAAAQILATLHVPVPAVTT